MLYYINIRKSANRYIRNSSHNLIYICYLAIYYMPNIYMYMYVYVLLVRTIRCISIIKFILNQSWKEKL